MASVLLRMLVANEHEDTTSSAADGLPWRWDPAHYGELLSGLPTLLLCTLNEPLCSLR